MGTSLNLFDDEEIAQTGRERIGAQSMVLRGYALPAAQALLAGVDTVRRQAPFRHMVTPAACPCRWR